MDIIKDRETLGIFTKRLEEIAPVKIRITRDIENSSICIISRRIFYSRTQMIVLPQLR